MGPYLVGFDTSAHYVPTTLNWLNGAVDPWSFIATAPMLYIFTTGLTFVSGSVVLVLKLLPPVLLGFLALSIYAYARQGLGWSQLKSIVPALVGTLYFVGLRVSWDALREVVALIFVFVVLTSLARIDAKHSWKNYLMYALALTVVILSNQVVAVLMLGIVLCTVLYKLLRENRVGAARILAFSLPATLLFAAMYYFSPAVSEYRLIFGFPSNPDGWLTLFGYSSYQAMLGSEAVFILFCFLPLLPLAFLSVRRLKNFQMQSWVVLILFSALIPMVSPSGLRLIMLLVYPLAFYATEGLSKLKSTLSKRNALFKAGSVFLVMVVVVPSLGFMVLPAETPFPYFSDKVNSHIYQIPSSMLQNTVPLSDCEGTAVAVQWLKTNMDNNTILLSHRAFYGWTLPELGADRILMYEYDNPADVAATAAKGNFSEVYLIWWVDGQGWYGLPSVPSVFHEVYRSGRIAVYTYEP